jgi:hypothetical protein
LRDNAAAGVQRSEVGAPGELVAITSLGEKLDCPNAISRRSYSAKVQNAQTRAADHRAKLTTLLMKLRSQGRIGFRSAFVLMHLAQRGATVTHTTITCLLEDGRCARVVAQHIFAREKLEAELVAGRRSPTFAGLDQPFGFGISRVTGGDGERRSKPQKEIRAPLR